MCGVLRAVCVLCCACVRGAWLRTGAQVGVLLGQVLALMDPFPVALEEDLQRGLGPAAQLDGVALDDVGVVRLLQEAGEGPGLEGLAPGPWDTHRHTVTLYIYTQGHSLYLKHTHTQAQSLYTSTHTVTAFT